MPLKLYYHPLASRCWKVLVALYEKKIPFTPHLVDLGNEQAHQDFLKIWPMGEFPVLVNEEALRTIPQSTPIIEYLEQYTETKIALIPASQDQALKAKIWNDFYDNYVHSSMQKIVGDVLRPQGDKDLFGVKEARDTLRSAYDILDEKMKSRVWAASEGFTLADCAAAPALYYANKVQPFEKTHTHLNQYLNRLVERPSFARVLNEAEPYFHLFPYRDESAN